MEHLGGVSRHVYLESSLLSLIRIMADQSPFPPLDRGIAGFGSGFEHKHKARMAQHRPPLNNVENINRVSDIDFANNATTQDDFASCVQSFARHYQRFVGYSVDEHLFWKYAASSMNTTYPKPSLWSYPLTKTIVMGAGSIAATLAIGVMLSESSDSQPTFTYRTDPAAPQLSPAAQTSPSDSRPIIEQPDSSLPNAVEFSNSHRLSASLTGQLPEVAISHTSAHFLSRHPAVEPSDGSSDRHYLTDLARIEALANRAPQSTPQPPSANELTSRPSADPILAIAQGMPAVTSSPPLLSRASLPGETLESQSASSDGAIALSNSESGQEPVSPNSLVSATPTPELQVTDPATQTDGVSHEELSVLEISPSVTLGAFESARSELMPEAAIAQSTPTSSVLTDMASSESPQRNRATIDPAAVTLKPSDADPDKARESLLGIQYFLTLANQVTTPTHYSLLPLTEKAASEAWRLPQIPRFRIFRLTPNDYQQAWALINVNNNDAPSTPNYGFIDYQRLLIVLPAPAASQGT